MSSSHSGGKPAATSSEATLAAIVASVDVLRSREVAGDSSVSENLTQALEFLGKQLVATGRVRDGIVPLEELVSRRRLAATPNGDSNARAILATALSFLGDCQELADMPEAALAAAEEAARIAFHLASTDPSGHVLQMRSTVRTLAARRRAQDEHADVSRLLGLADEAVWWLASASPAERFDWVLAGATSAGTQPRTPEGPAIGPTLRPLPGLGPDNPASSTAPDRQALAGVLSGLSGRLREVGEHDKAAAVSAQVLEIHRRLQAEDPGHDVVEYVRAVCEIAEQLGAEERHREAFGALDEAIAGLRAGLESDRTMYGPLLAQVLDRRGVQFGRTQYYARGAQDGREAADLLRSLTEPHPMLLATTLENLAEHQAQVSGSSEAVATLRVATDILRSGATTDEAAGFRLAWTLERLAKHLSDTDGYDVEEVVSLLSEAVDIWRLNTGTEEADRQQAASALARLARQMEGLDLVYEAIEVAKESMARYGVLAADAPRRHGSAYADVLYLLAYCQSDVGAVADAVETARLLDQQLRMLLTASPGELEPFFAFSLRTLSILSSHSGRIDEAVGFADEAVRILELLVETGRADLQELILALALLANFQAEAGDVEQSLDALREGLALAPLLPDSASQASAEESLWRLIAERMQDLGRLEDATEALAAAQTSAEIVATLNPVDLDSVDVIAADGLRLIQLGLWSKATVSMEYAVSRYRQALAAGGLGDELVLAYALHNLSLCYSSAGLHLRSVHALTEELEVYERRGANVTEPVQVLTAAAFHNLGAELAILGRDAASLHASREATRIRRKLVGAGNSKRPGATSLDLARSLANLAIRLSAAGETTEALEATRESVRLRREGAERNPTVFPELATSLLGFVQVRLTHQVELDAALAAAHESLVIYQGLQRSNPGAYQSRITYLTQVVESMRL